MQNNHLLKFKKINGLIISHLYFDEIFNCNNKKKNTNLK